MTSHSISLPAFRYSALLRVCTTCIASLLAAGSLALAALCLTAPSLYAAGPGTACQGSGAVRSQTVCIVMPGSGTFQLPIPGTPAKLIGNGTPDRRGKAIAITRVPLVCPSLGGFGIKITTPRSAGLLPPLRWASGTLYARSASRSNCSPIYSPALAAAPGVYQVVPASIPGAMPRTGGAGAPPPGGLPLSAMVLAMGSVLLGSILLLFGRDGNPA